MRDFMAVDRPRFTCNKCDTDMTESDFIDNDGLCEECYDEEQDTEEEERKE